MTSRTTPNTRRPAPKKPTTPKAPPATSPKTEKKPSAHFSLVVAAREREETEERPEPFTVEVAEGEFVTLRDPQDLGWQEAAVLTIEQPYLMMQTLLSDEDYDKFIQVDYKIPDMVAMQKAWAQHYDAEGLLGN